MLDVYIPSSSAMLFSTTIALTIAAFAFASPSSDPVTRALPPKAALITSCTVPGTVALTFDDGPFTYLQTVVDTLKAAGAVGTFFFNGNNYECIYSADNIKRVQYAYSNGHQVCSHTWAHLDLATLTQANITSEMARTDQAIQRILGVVPAFFRPPFGSYNDLVLTVAGSRGQTAVTWDLDSGDSSNFTVAQTNAVYDAVVLKKPSTILALNHEVYLTTANSTLPYALGVLKKAGYKMVSVADCLGQKPYLSIGPPGIPAADWIC